MTADMNHLKPATSIWRYMDVARFLALICDKKIYFARLHDLNDPWEGSRSPSDPMFLSDPEYVGLAAQQFNSKPLISCWHENEGESVAMWKLYVSGREGVAVQTTVGRLGRFASANKELKIGRVEYENIDGSEHWPSALLFESGAYTGCKDVLNGERAFFRKNRGYRHEQEVRAVLYDYYCAEQAVAAAAHPELISLSLGIDGDEVVRGETIPGDLSLLIERIVVSPEFPRWAIGSLQKTVDAAGIPVKVEPSSLLDRPVPHAASHR